MFKTISIIILSVTIFGVLVFIWGFGEAGSGLPGLDTDVLWQLMLVIVKSSLS